MPFIQIWSLCKRYDSRIKRFIRLRDTASLKLRLDTETLTWCDMPSSLSGVSIYMSRSGKDLTDLPSIKSASMSFLDFSFSFLGYECAIAGKDSRIEVGNGGDIRFRESKKNHNTAHQILEKIHFIGKYP